MTSEFRTPEEEVTRLLQDTAQLRDTLRQISAQLARIENRIKRAFPVAAAEVSKRSVRVPKSRTLSPSLTEAEAQREFDEAVRLAASGDSAAAERFLSAKDIADLMAVARQVGISLGKSNPSKKALIEGLFGRVRESLMLSRHLTQPRGPREPTD